MKKLIAMLVIFFVVIAFGVPVFAATDVASGGSAVTSWLMTLLIPILAPLAIEFLKKLLPVIRNALDSTKLTWVYPLIAAVIGVVIDYLAGLGNGPTIAAVSGLAGVGLYDAAKSWSAMGNK